MVTTDHHRAAAILSVPRLDDHFRNVKNGVRTFKLRMAGSAGTFVLYYHDPGLLRLNMPLELIVFRRGCVCGTLVNLRPTDGDAVKRVIERQASARRAFY